MTQQDTQGQMFPFIMVHSVTTDTLAQAGQLPDGEWSMSPEIRIQKQVTGCKPEDSKN